MSGEEWRWEFTDGCRRAFEGLDEYARERIVSKLDEIVTDQWRDPSDYLEPLRSTTPKAPRRGVPVGLSCRSVTTRDVRPADQAARRRRIP